MKMNTPRLRVCLDTLRLDNKELMHKPGNVRPLFPTTSKLQEQLLKLQDLAQERIASSKELCRIQTMMTGVKHVNAVIACHTLGAAYLVTKKRTEIGLAVSLLIQTEKIRRRISDDNRDRALSLSQNLRIAKAAQARFDEGGVLSAMPCCWAPTSRQVDQAIMAKLFAGLQARNGKRRSPNMSSEAMEHCLRPSGLFNVTVSACDSVSGL